MSERAIIESPPGAVISFAVDVARGSPCAKSKRGAVVFCDLGPGLVQRYDLVGSGYNGQPSGLCSADRDCFAWCGKTCVHAEARAIRNAVATRAAGQRVYSALLRGCELLHAKIVDGRLVPGGGPSCWQCSREVLDVELDAVWLYELERVCGSVCATARDACSNCDGIWRRYTAQEFHDVTLRYHEMKATR